MDTTDIIITIAIAVLVLTVVALTLMSSALVPLMSRAARALNRLLSKRNPLPPDVPPPPG